MRYILDENIKRDTHFVANLHLCEIRLMNDNRWLWFILIPRIANITELYQLEQKEQIRLLSEIQKISYILKENEVDKINIGSLGNIVNQLHIHVIGRKNNDAGWPGPVWGLEGRIPYNQEELDSVQKKFWRLIGSD